MSLSESREDWILREARKRPLAERTSFLDGACAGDHALRNRMEADLAASEPSDAAIPQRTDVERSTLKIDSVERPDEGVRA